MNNRANNSPTTMQASPTIRPSNSTQKPADHSNLNLKLDNAPLSSVSNCQTTSTGTPYRKPPHCSQCKQPRKGHPRSGCTFSKLSSSMIEIKSPSESTLTEALGTVGEEYNVIKAAVSEHQNLQPVKQNPTPLTLSANYRENVEHISRPELVAAVTTNPPLAIETTVKDQMLTQHSLSDSIPLPRNISPTSFTRNLTSKQAFPTNSERAQAIHSDPPMEFKKSGNNTDACNADLALPPHGHVSESFHPTASVDRDFILAKLSEKAVAAIYIVPKIDAQALVAQAVALQLSAKLVTSQNDNDPNALIIFDHEEKAPRTLLRATITLEDVKAGTLKGSTVLRASVAAVVVGAIGAWAALAFA